MMLVYLLTKLIKTDQNLSKLDDLVWANVGIHILHSYHLQYNYPPCIPQIVVRLVVWNMNLFFHSVGNVIIPMDELIFFRRVQTMNQYNMVQNGITW